MKHSITKKWCIYDKGEILDTFEKLEDAIKTAECYFGTSIGTCTQERISDFCVINYGFRPYNYKLYK